MIRKLKKRKRKSKTVQSVPENIVLNAKILDEEFRILEILYQKSMNVDDQFRESEDHYFELLQDVRSERNERKRDKILQERDKYQKENIEIFEEFLEIFNKIRSVSEDFTEDERLEYDERLKYIENYVKDFVRNDISFQEREKSVKLDIMRSEMNIVTRAITRINNQEDEIQEESFFSKIKSFFNSEEIESFPEHEDDPEYDDEVLLDLYDSGFSFFSFGNSRKAAEQALEYVKQKHKDIIRIERGINEINDMMNYEGILLEMQHLKLLEISEMISVSDNHIQKGRQILERI